MNKFTPHILSFVAGILIVIYFTQNYPNNSWSVLIVALLINLLSTPIIFLVVSVLDNINRLPIWIRTKIRFRNQYIRISFSYLFRIKVKGKYLLVKNRSGDYYQLVGGAYKRYITSEGLFDKYKIRSDRMFNTSHGIAKNDLRIHVLGKHVLKVMTWFKSKEDREISQWREFCEELLSTNILPKNEFRFIDYKYMGSVQTPIQKAKHLDCLEILHYEIFDLIPSTEQNKILEDLVDLGDNEHIKWADETIINSLGFNEASKSLGYRIGVHTKWALNMQYAKD